MGKVIVGALRLGRLAKTLTASATLTKEEQESFIMEFAGSGLSGTVTVTLYSPDDGAMWRVYNNTGYSLVLKVSGATGITIANARVADCYCDGTDVRRATADSVRT
jgi:hypothetical protein